MAKLSGKVRICYEKTDETGHKMLNHMSFADFRNFYANRSIKVSEDKFETLPTLWLKQPNRPQFEEVVLMPKGECPKNHFNLWRGWGVEPKLGTWQKYKWHLLNIICKGNQKYYDYLIRWMAYSVQFPDEQGWAIIVLKGLRGCGKGSFVMGFGPVYGNHFTHITSPKHFVGNFNAHLRYTLCLFVDEAYWAGDKAVEGIIQGFATEKSFMIESKGIDAEHWPNRLHIIMATNNDWAVPAGPAERRFFVLNVSDAKVRDKAYFDALFEEIQNGGRAALLYDLLHMDLSQFDVRSVPNTEGLNEQKLQSMDSLTAYWYERLRTGTMPLFDGTKTFLDYGTGWERVAVQDLYLDYVRVSKEAGINRRSSETIVGMGLKKFLPNFRGWPHRRPHMHRGLKTYFYHFPPLEQCRRDFNIAMNTNYAWDEDEDEE